MFESNSGKISTLSDTYNMSALLMPYCLTGNLHIKSIVIHPMWNHSTVIPRNFTWDLSVTSESSRIIRTLSACWFFPIAMFKDNLLALNQSGNCANSLFMVRVRISKDLEE